jgi:hypothetical protein
MKDPRGNAVSTRSSAALAHAETALWRMASFFDAPLVDIDAASAEDPAWCLPHLMRANFLLTLTEPSLLQDARLALTHAQALMRHSNDRERMHFQATTACASGDWRGACVQWQAILDAHPHDLFALQCAHLFDFYVGDAGGLESRPARALKQLDVADPLRPYVLGMHAFGLEENAHYDHAEAVGRAAVSSAAKVPWATHAVAHVMEMQGRYSDGLQWLRANQSTWAEGNGFANHHWWHTALFHLEGMDIPAALALYDQHLSSPHASITLNRLDGAALLWRLHLLGDDAGGNAGAHVGTRWLDVAQDWDLSPAPAGLSAFNDAHAVMVLLGQQRHGDAEALVDEVQKRLDVGNVSEAAVTMQVGLPLLRGLLAFGREDFASAVRLLWPLRADLLRVGGSHAQRDGAIQTLLVAALRSGETAISSLLLKERQGKQNTPLTQHWRHLPAPSPK